MKEAKATNQNYTKEAKPAANRIEILYHMGGGPECKLCGGLTSINTSAIYMPGLLYFFEGSHDPICENCIEKNDPSFFSNMIEVQNCCKDMESAALERGYKAGLEDGKRKAGELILKAIDEKPLDHIRQICHDVARGFWRIWEVGLNRRR